MSHHPCGFCGERHFGDCMKSWRPDTDAPYKLSKQTEPTFNLTFSGPNYRFEVIHDWDNQTSNVLGLGWCAVVDEEAGGIIAYFGKEDDAWEFVKAMRAKHKCDGLAALYMRAHSKG